MPTNEEIMEKLREVTDPDIGINIVDLGLVYNIEIKEKSNITVRMTLTSPGCPFGPILLSQVEEAVKKIPEVAQVSINLVWEPTWNPETMASDTAKDALGIW
jgi:metal-sulfur cluster biosynthetic enzyme